MADFEPKIEILHNRNHHNSNTGSINHSTIVIEKTDFVNKVTFWHQFVALFLKDLSLQLKSVATNLCQLLVPIIFISFAGIIQLVINHLLHKNGALVPGSDSFVIPVDVGHSIACTKNNSFYPEDCYDPVFNFLVDFDIDAWASKNNDSKLEELLELIIKMPTQQVLFDLPFYYIGKHPSVDLPLSKNTSRTGLQALLLPTNWIYNFSLNFTINPNYTNRNFDEDIKYVGNNLEIPFFLPITGNDTSSLQKHLLSVVKDYNRLAQSTTASDDQYDRIYEVTAQSQTQYNVTLERIQRRDFNKTKPNGGIFFNHFNNSEHSIKLDYTIIANEMTVYSLRGLEIDKFQNSSTDMEIQRRSNIINIVHNGIFKHLRNETAQPDNVTIATYIMPLPSEKSELTIDITNILGSVLYPFSVSFLFPIFIAALVKDKSERHLIMMEQNGLSRSTYWVITYIFDYILYSIIAIVIAIFSLIWQVRIFTQTNAVVLIILFLLWGHSQVVLGFFFANFFNGPRTATIVGYILVIAGVMISLILELLQVFPFDKTPFPLYMMYPPFAFYRILFYMNSVCANYQCYTIDILSASDGLNLVTTAILYLAGSTILLLLVSIYLSYVLPSEFGVRKSPFFPIIAIYNGCLWLLRKIGLKKKSSKNELTSLRANQSRNIIVDIDDEEEVDEDVLQEEDMIRQSFSPESPIVMYQLRKEYSGSGGKSSHVAVESFSLAINRNECFGLLGPNGAGKTTLISVLTGLYEPTEGRARIAGYDLSTQISEIHRHLGVCPQFDIQYPELTCEEHLLFYARLKGAKIGKTGRIVENALRQVNLYDAKKRKSRALSGGMRRRLSVAMACIGSPDILILDEPTTGLDPASRRQVWEVITKVKEGRSIILTTHAMEEADQLCTRIGIMNYGRLCCLGSQTRLKAKFGTGYQLKFHCAPGQALEVERFIQRNLRVATHMETYANSCTYHLEKENVVVSELFELLDSVRDQIGIVDWGIKMTTLEDVFLNIVQKHSGTRTEINGSTCPSWLPCQCSCFSLPK